MTIEALAAEFRLPGRLTIAQETLKPAGQFTVGCLHLSGGTPGTASDTWTTTFSAVQDGPNEGWRYTTLTVVPARPACPPVDFLPAENIIRRWEAALAEGNTRNLHGQFYEGSCCVAASTLNGEYYVFSDPEYLISVLNTVTLWGPAKLSEMSFAETAAGCGVVTVFGKWNLVHPVLGSAPYAITGTLVETEEGWKTVSLCASAG